MCHLRKETISALISALSRKIPDLWSLLNMPNQQMYIGSIGKKSAWSTTSILFSSTAMTPSPSSNSLHNGIEMAARLPCTNPSDLERWKMPSMWWARRSPIWGPGHPEIRLWGNRLQHLMSISMLQEGRCPTFPYEACPRHWHHLHPPTGIHTFIHAQLSSYCRSHHHCLLLSPSPR
jgi:hypothetical protein